MIDHTGTAGTIEEKAREDGGAPVDVDSAFWLAELTAAEDRETAWRKIAEGAIRAYRDESERNFGQINLFAANVKVIGAATGADFGRPSVSRKFPRKGKDQAISRTVSLVLERTLEASAADNGDDNEILTAIKDSRIQGRGICWVENEPEADETGAVVWQTTRIVHVQWDDFRHGAGRSWRDVPWVARRHLFSKDDLIKYWPKHAEGVPLGYTVKGSHSAGRTGQTDRFKRACVWEIWNKIDKTREYVAEGYETKLQVDADPFRLRDFFPCAAPIYADRTGNSLIPLTDYQFIRDQLEEINQLSARIYSLTDALKHRGVYDKSVEELKQLVTAGDNTLIPVENWTQLQGAGGLSKAVEWEDITSTASVLVQLHEQRRTLIDLIYQLTGISDIMRGQSDPNETMGAQQIKRDFGSVRMDERQTQQKNFARDLYRLKGEFVAEHYGRDQLEAMSGIRLPLEAEQEEAKALLAQVQAVQAAAARAQQTGQPVPPVQMPPREALAEAAEIAQAPTWEAVSAILRSDQMRLYRIGIETDKSKVRDASQEKADRLEFLNTMLAVIEKMAPLLAQGPAMGPFVKESVMFAARAFDAGREVEEQLEAAISQAIAQPPKPPAQAADPVAAAQAKLIEGQAQKVQIDLQAAQQKAALEAQIKGVELEMAKINLQLKAAELQIKEQEVQAKAAGQQIELQSKLLKASAPMPMQGGM